MLASFCTRRNSKMLVKAVNFPWSRPIITSANTDLEQPNQKKRCQRHEGTGHLVRRLLKTLNPSKLDPADFIDISHINGCRVWFSGSAEPSILSYHSDGFPNDTKGFFYYNAPPPHLPPIMGELRFRITSTSDPSCFDGGSDLLSPSKLRPWSVPLLRLASGTQIYKPVCEHLVAEGLVSQKLSQRCRLIWTNSFGGYFDGHPPHLFHHLKQPFFLKFTSYKRTFALWVVKEEKTSKCELRRPTSKVTGCGFFRLEKLDDRYLGFRMMKIIEPPRIIPDLKVTPRYPIDIPVEGEMVRRRGKLLRLDMDAEEARALRDLPVIDGVSR